MICRNIFERALGLVCRIRLAGHSPEEHHSLAACARIVDTEEICSGVAFCDAHIDRPVNCGEIRMLRILDIVEKSVVDFIFNIASELDCILESRCVSRDFVFRCLVKSLCQDFSFCFKFARCIDFEENR